MECYKWDTTFAGVRGTSADTRLANSSSKNEQDKRRFSGEELHRLAKYFDVLIEMEQKQRALHKRAVAEPGGFAMPGEGRMCSLCRNSVHIDGWFDK